MNRDALIMRMVSVQRGTAGATVVGGGTSIDRRSFSWSAGEPGKMLAVWPSGPMPSSTKSRRSCPFGRQPSASRSSRS